MKNLFKKAKYKHNVGNGILYARFKLRYIEKVIKYCSGNLKIFLKAIIENYGYTHNRLGKVYLNKFSIEYILGEIKYFKKHNKWRKA